MGEINYENSQPDYYNDFEDAEKYLPIFGEDSETESCVQFDDSGNMYVADSLPCGMDVVEIVKDVEEKSSVGQEVYEDSGFSVEDEQVLAKIKAFFARRALEKTRNEGNLDLDLNGHPIIGNASTAIPAPKEDKGIDLSRVPDQEN